EQVWRGEGLAARGSPLFVSDGSLFVQSAVGLPRRIRWLQSVQEAQVAPTAKQNDESVFVIRLIGDENSDALRRIELGGKDRGRGLIGLVTALRMQSSRPLKDITLSIEADQTVRYQVVADIIELARAAGVERFVLKTRSAPEEPAEPTPKATSSN